MSLANRSALGRLLGAVRQPPVWLTLLAGAVLLLHVREGFYGGVRSNDIHTYWQYARNILDGRGFVGNTLSTLQLWQYGFAPRPVSVVLHPLAVAAAWLITGEWVSAAVFCSCLFYLVTLVFLYWVAEGWVGRRAAVLASLLFIFNPKAVLYTLYGGSDPLFTVLLLGATGLLARVRTTPGFAGAGLLLGLGAIARPVGMMYLPPALLLVLGRGPAPFTARLLRTAAVVGMFWAVGHVVPWVNVHGFGNGELYRQHGTEKSGALLSHSPVLPRYTAKRLLVMPDTPLRLIAADPYVRRGFAGKVRTNLRLIAGNLLADLWGTKAAGLLALLGWGLAVFRRDTRLLALWFAACLAFQLAVLSVSLYSTRYVYPLTPFGLMLTAVGLEACAGALRGRAREAVPGFLAAAVCALILPLPVGRALDPTGRLTVAPVREASIEPYRLFGRFLDDALPAGVPLLCDGGPWLPDVYATGRRIIATYPRTMRMLETLHREKIDVDALLLTSFYVDDDAGSWRYLFEWPQPFLGFRPRIFEDGRLRAVLYVRDSRLEALRRLHGPEVSGQDLGAALCAVGQALQIDPRCRQALDRLALLRGQAAREAEALKASAAREAASGRLEEAARLLIKGGGLADGLTLNLSAGWGAQLVAKEWLRPVEWTREGAELTLSGMPMGALLSDGLCRQSGYFGGPEDVEAALPAPGIVDEVVLTALMDATVSRLTRITVSTSVDGVNWKPARRFEVPGGLGGGYVAFDLHGLGLLTARVRVSVEGDDFHAVELQELEIRGFKPVEAGDEAFSVQPRSPLQLRTGVNLDTAYHATGKRAPGVSGWKAHAPADPAGLLVYGRYFALQPGQYEAVFEICARGSAAYTAEVTGERGRKVLVSARGGGADMRTRQIVRLPFVLERAQEVEPRLRFEGRGELACSKIGIEGIPRITLVRDPA